MTRSVFILTTKKMSTSTNRIRISILERPSDGIRIKMICESVNSFVYIIRMIIIRWDHFKQDSHTSWIFIQVIAYSKVLFILISCSRLFISYQYLRECTGQ